MSVIDVGQAQPDLRTEADPRVQVIDDPVKRRQVDRFDDAHVVEGDVKVVLSERLELAAGEAGAAEGGEPIAIGPLDGAEDIRAVAGAADGDEEIAGIERELMGLVLRVIEHAEREPAANRGGRPIVLAVCPPQQRRQETSVVSNWT